MKVFITGTDTNVGKTIIAAWLCYHLKAAYWKPLQTGSDRDSETVAHLTGCKVYPEAYVLKKPLSPYSAAKFEEISLEPTTIVKPTNAKLIIEGAGGVMVPIQRDFFMIDLIKQLKVPVIIVARSILGTINHTCLTIEALHARDIPILGVVLNGPLNKNNKATIEEVAKIAVLEEFTPLEKIGDFIYRLPSSILQKTLYEYFKA